jgi:predicted sulfurtransferase
MVYQMIFTSTSARGVSLKDKVNVAAYSVRSCKTLGLTGRVLVVPEMALNILEGPEAIVTAYVEAIRGDSLIELLVIHHSQSIEAREFEDYSVWMTYKPDEQIQDVYHLSADNLEDALPKTLSRKTRLFISANFALDEMTA